LSVASRSRPILSAFVKEAYNYAVPSVQAPRPPSSFSLSLSLSLAPPPPTVTSTIGPARLAGSKQRKTRPGVAELSLTVEHFLALR